MIDTVTVSRDVDPGSAAWGAKTGAAEPAGTHNTVTIDLKGVSAQADTATDGSERDEPAGTNRATIHQ